MNSCAKIRGQLAWFVGNDLDPGQSALVRAHLRDCVVCRREAGGLQQSVRALQSLDADAAPGVDETMFASMQQQIMTAVEQQMHTGELVAADRGPVAALLAALRGWPISAVAAVAMFLFGWWLVRDAEPVGWRDRPPLATSIFDEGPAKAVPWSGGGRVELRPLGDEWLVRDGGVESGGGPGMLGPGMLARWQLKTLESDSLDAPVPVPAWPVQTGPGGALGRKEAPR